MNAEEAIFLERGLMVLTQEKKQTLRKIQIFHSLTPLTQSAVILLKSLIQTLSLRVQDVLVSPMQKQIMHE